MRRIPVASTRLGRSYRCPVAAGREPRLSDRFPLTDNDTATTERVASAFADFFADRAGVIPHLRTRPTWDTGTAALVVAALAWLAR
jgi:hypothetical protein